MAKIGRNIREQRMKKGLSQEELAERLYVTRQTISNYETGRSDPDVEMLTRLAEALDTDIQLLIYGEPKKRDMKQIRRAAARLAVILLVWFLLPAFGFNEHLQNKIILFLIFITVTILGSMWWDWKTYLWNKNTHIDEMSVAEVSRRMTRFRNWTRYEIWAVAVWTVIFTILFFWIMDYYTLPLMVQAVLLGCYIILDALLIYFIYKKVVYKHLDSIKKNIEELKDICTE